MRSITTLHHFAPYLPRLYHISPHYVNAWAIGPPVVAHDIIYQPLWTSAITLRHVVPVLRHPTIDGQTHLSCTVRFPVAETLKFSKFVFDRDQIGCLPHSSPPKVCRSRYTHGGRAGPEQRRPERARHTRVCPSQPDDARRLPIGVAPVGYQLLIGRGKRQTADGRCAGGQMKIVWVMSRADNC